jgi:pyruvate dehydrogenase E2 component (dihydrolipoamide acetyltransferase)
MATAVIMPRQGQSVESCIITGWHKHVGDKVNINDILFSYETDKSTFEEEAKVEGEMLAIFFEEGDDVECLVNVCVIGEKGEDISEFLPTSDDNNKNELSSSAPVTTPVITTETTNDSTTITTGKIKISPRARKMAEKNNISIDSVAATGPGGRIIARDIQSLIDSGQASFVKETPIQRKGELSSPESEIIPLSTVRKTISKVMHASLQNSAQLTFDTSFDATDIFEFRKKAKQAMGDSGVPIPSINDIIIYAASRVLLKHKSLNAHFLNDETMKVFNVSHIALAVDTPRGLLVPTIFNASEMGLSQLTAESKRLQSLCAQGTINPDLLQGASFTISNLGTMGIEAFTPILNPPQTGILGVCATIERLRNEKSYPAMGLSLTYDHRALDGADAARFLKDLVNYLENFTVFSHL